MKLLFGVVSCYADEKNGREQAILDTWLGSANDSFVAKGPRVFDGYDSLPYKVQRICMIGLNKNYDFLFKCDVDTYVRPEKIKSFLYSDNDALIPFVSDYIGFILTGETYCSGGAGYVLSRKAMEIVARAEVDDTVEDRWVGNVLAGAGIIPLHSRSFMPWRVPITKSNDAISVHLSEPGHVYDKQWMYDIHREWEES